MGRKPKIQKEIEFNSESLMVLLQEIYNEIVTQRNTAISIQNKMLGFMKQPEDLAMLGPIIKEQQKIIDNALNKKLDLAKLQHNVMVKSGKGGDSEESVGSLSDEDKALLFELMEGGEDPDKDKE